MAKIPVKNSKGEVIGYKNQEGPANTTQYANDGSVRKTDSLGDTQSLQLPVLEQYGPQERAEIQKLWSARHKVSVDPSYAGEERLMALTAIDDKIKSIPPMLPQQKQESPEEIFKKSIVEHNGRSYQMTKSGEFKPLDKNDGIDDKAMTAALENAQLELEETNPGKTPTQDEIFAKAEQTLQNQQAFKQKLLGGQSKKSGYAWAGSPEDFDSRKTPEQIAVEQAKNEEAENLFQEYAGAFGVENPDQGDYDYRAAFEAGVIPTTFKDLPKEKKVDEIRNAMKGKYTGKPMTRPAAERLLAERTFWPDKFAKGQQAKPTPALEAFKNNPQAFVAMMEKLLQPQEVQALQQIIQSKNPQLLEQAMASPEIQAALAQIGGQ